MNVLRSADFKQLPGLFWIACSHPLFIIPTLKATRETMKIAQQEYGNAHKGNTPANAFRHALWNVLIAKHCLKRKQNFKKVLLWTEKITAKHEKLAPNKTLERAMDLHNNQIGLMHCSELVSQDNREIIAFLKNEAGRAKKVNQLAEIEKANKEMVYLS